MKKLRTAGGVRLRGARLQGAHSTGRRLQVLRMQPGALLLALLLLTAASASAAPQSYNATLRVRLLAVDDIVLQAQPDPEAPLLLQPDTGGFTLPAGVFVYTGIHIPNTTLIPFNLGTRVLSSVHFDFSNAEGVFEPDFPELPLGNEGEFGGPMSLMGGFEMIFSPFTSTSPGIGQYTSTPIPLVMDGSVFGLTTHSKVGNNAAIKVEYLGGFYRTGRATILQGSAPHPTVTDDAYADLDNPWLNTFSQPGSDTRTVDHVGNITMVSPAYIHITERRPDFNKRRRYTLKSYFELTVSFLAGTEGAGAVELPEPTAGLLCFAAAAALGGLGERRRRRLRAERE